MKNYREIILERKHRRRQESAGQTSSVSTAAANDSQINIATGQDFPEKVMPI